MMGRASGPECGCEAAAAMARKRAVVAAQRTRESGHRPRSAAGAAGPLKRFVSRLLVQPAPIAAEPAHRGASPPCLGLHPRPASGCRILHRPRASSHVAQASPPAGGDTTLVTTRHSEPAIPVSSKPLNSSMFFGLLPTRGDRELQLRQLKRVQGALHGPGWELRNFHPSLVLAAK